MTIKQVAILGSTGSIGVNTLDVIRAHPERFKVAALTASKQVDRLAQQCIEFKPAIAVLADADGARASASPSAHLPRQHRLAGAGAA